MTHKQMHDEASAWVSCALMSVVCIWLLPCLHHRWYLFMGPLSLMTDEELDDTILRLCSHYQRAGISMLDGMLWHLGHQLPCECIRTSLMRIDPIQHVFQWVQIQRCVYSIPGPMSLWHHDGQHGL